MNDTSSQIEVPTPRVIKWFNVYCWIGCFFHISVVLFSLVFFRSPLEELEMSSSDANFIGILCVLFGIVFFALFALPLLVPPRPWLWTYDLILICLGLTSACFLILCVPMLVSWVKPETKRYFGTT